jgi:NAD dependent epimerase/dehydratase family enzyme
MSWIHNEDMSWLILFALDNAAVSGPMNATAPNPVTNRDFGHTAGRVLRRPSFLPTPAFAMRVGVGEAANVMTTGQRVVPRRALELGYAFRFPELEPALRDLLGRPLTR